MEGKGLPIQRQDRFLLEVAYDVELGGPKRSEIERQLMESVPGTVSSESPVNVPCASLAQLDSLDVS